MIQTLCESYKCKRVEIQTLGDLWSSADEMADHRLTGCHGNISSSLSAFGTFLPKLLRAGSLPRRTTRPHPERVNT